MGQSQTRIAVLRMGLAGGVYKKGCKAKQRKNMMERLQEKVKKVDEDTSKFLKLIFDRITKEELSLLTDQLLEYSTIMVSYILEVKNREESFDYIKVPQVVETGWQTFKWPPMTMDKDERKQVTLKFFDDCLQEKTMAELCKSFAELSSKD